MFSYKNDYIILKSQRFVQFIFKMLVNLCIHADTCSYKKIN